MVGRKLTDRSVQYRQDHPALGIRLSNPRRLP